MNMKRVTIGSIAGLVILYIVGVVFWEMIFVDFFAANAGTAEGVEREEEIIWATALGALFYAMLVTLMLEARSGATSIVHGIKIGAVVGFLLWGTADFTLFGYLNLNNLTATIADSVLEGVRGGIAGAVIAAVLSKIGD